MGSLQKLSGVLLRHIDSAFLENDSNTFYLYSKDVGNVIVTDPVKSDEFGRWYEFNCKWNDEASVFQHKYATCKQMSRLNGCFETSSELLHVKSELGCAKVLLENGKPGAKFEGSGVVLDIHKEYMVIWHCKVGLIIHPAKDDVNLETLFAPLDPVMFNAIMLNFPCRFFSFAATSVKSNRSYRTRSLFFAKDVELVNVNDNYIAKTSDGKRIILLDKHLSLCKKLDTSSEESWKVAYYKVSTKKGDSVYIGGFLTDEYCYNEIFDRVTTENKTLTLESDEEHSSSCSEQDILNVLRIFDPWDIDNDPLDWCKSTVVEQPRKPVETKVKAKSTKILESILFRDMVTPKTNESKNQSQPERFSPPVVSKPQKIDPVENNQELFSSHSYNNLNCTNENMSESEIAKLDSKLRAVSCLMRKGYVEYNQEMIDELHSKTMPKYIGGKNYRLNPNNIRYGQRNYTQSRNYDSRPNSHASNNNDSSLFERPSSNQMNWPTQPKPFQDISDSVMSTSSSPIPKTEQPMQTIAPHVDRYVHQTGSSKSSWDEPSHRFKSEWTEKTVEDWPRPLNRYNSDNVQAKRFHEELYKNLQKRLVNESSGDYIERVWHKVDTQENRTIRLVLNSLMNDSFTRGAIRSFSRDILLLLLHTVLNPEEPFFVYDLQRAAININDIEDNSPYLILIHVERRIFDTIRQESRLWLYITEVLPFISDLVLPS